jgi:AcrR family transcriptional regulator
MAMTAQTHPHPLRERQRQERERLILQATEELLLERGYHEMSIDDIAARVGIAKGTVYQHFASKDDLVLALVERGMRALLRNLDITLSSDAAPREKLYAIIEQFYAGMSSTHYQVFSAIFRNPQLFTRLSEQKQALGDLWSEPLRRITAVLEEGKAAGDFDPNMPTPVMLSLFWSLLTLHRFQRLPIEEQIPLDAFVRHLSQYFFKGIAPDGHPQSSQRGAQS